MIDRYGAQRAALIERVRERGIRDLEILRAIDQTPRHDFVPAAVAHRAYEDAPIPIGFGQTASQRPHKVEAFGRAAAWSRPITAGVSAAPIGPA